MMLNARRIALQGFGSVAMAIAVQGFTATALVAPPPSFYGGGGFSGSGEYHDRCAELADRAKARRIHAQNQIIIAALMAAMTKGMLQ